jgi:hypothetical protein
MQKFSALLPGFLLFFCAPVAQSQQEVYVPRPVVCPAIPPVCRDLPRDDREIKLLVPPSGAEHEESPVDLPSSKIDLEVPTGTPLRIAIDQRTRISHAGEFIHGKVVEAIYAFDQAVIPEGSVVTGQVTRILPISAARRTLAYANGKLTPPHEYEVRFDGLTLPDGLLLAIRTTVSRGTVDVVHLESDLAKEKQRNAAGRAAENAKQEVKEKVHGAVAQIKTQGRVHRLKEFALAQLPYRPQYIEPGTRFNASLDEPLDFGETTRTHAQIAAIGQAPPPDTLLHARLVLEVNSATARRGTPVLAVLTKPLFSTDHRLILPADTRLIGQVVQAKPARRLHHNGVLRFIFEHIETPEGSLQAMQGSLEGIEVERAARVKLDEEGGAHTSDSKTRYLSTGVAVLLAAAASHPDTEHGGEDPAGDPGIRAGAGGSGLGYAGALISFVAKSSPVSMAFAAYGASTSLYFNFLSRGRDVVFRKDTPLEVGFGTRHPSETAAQP